MKKRTIAMIVCLVLTLTVSLGSTLAYLTDNDADINVMTLGHVEIVQNEQQRVENDTEFTDELEPFEDGKILLPVTKREGTADEVTVGDHELTLSDDENNYVDKIISATNTGSVDAYVRTLVAVPTGGADWESTPVSADNCWLHWNIPTDYSNYWTLISSNVPMIEIDGQNYYIWEFIHKDVLEEGETTFPMVRGFYMDKRVDYNVDEGYYYLTYEDGTTKKVEDFASTDSVKIYALTQAVQADGFSDPTTALDAGFGDVNATNAATWFGGWTEDDIGSPGDKNDTNNPPEYVTNLTELNDALADGGSVIFGADITGDGTTVVIPDGMSVTFDLNGYDFVNPVAGAAALENNGTLKISGGSIANGTNSTRASHTIVNKGTLEIEDGVIGTDDTAGAAVVNYGTTVINGGTFASKQENTKGDNLCAYAFINQSGTMTINNATLNGQTHGLFGAYGGEIVVNGGSYTMDGNDGLGCYVVYATGEAKVHLLGGVIRSDEPRSNRVFFVYDNGNYFNAAAVNTGKIIMGNATIYLNGVEQSY